jgi:hypothetical protein
MTFSLQWPIFELKFKNWSLSGRIGDFGFPSEQRLTESSPLEDFLACFHFHFPRFALEAYEF